ncbi:hypothetical protein LXJ58_35605, partial [Escherichia coli]|nr:hypothetical protein [Escherichia coli]
MTMTNDRNLVRRLRIVCLAALGVVLLLATAPAQSLAEAAAYEDDARAQMVAAPASADEAQAAEDAFYCRERRLGQWFYCEKPRAKPK